MPIRYDVYSELNILICVCRGSINAGEIFDTADRIAVDERRKPGFIVIADLFDSVEDLHLKDIYESIERVEKAAGKGGLPRRVAMLSRSRGIHILTETIKLLPSKVQFPIDAFYTMEDAMISLGVGMQRQEIIQFWEETRSLFENS